MGCTPSTAVILPPLLWLLMAHIQQMLSQPARPSILEDLPAELKLEIIRACPNIKTLLALISASSTYLSVYKTNSPDLTFTIVTLQELGSRGIILDPRAHWVAVPSLAPSVKYRPFGQYGVHNAIRTYYEVMAKSATNSIVLPRAICRSLLTTRDAISFWTETDEAGKLKKCYSRKPTLDCNVQLYGMETDHLIYYALRSYHMLNARFEKT